MDDPPATDEHLKASSKWELSMRLFKLSWLLATLGFIAPACHGSEPGQARHERCLQLIEQHVEDSRGWDRTLYRIEEEGSGNSDRGFAVQYLDDLKVLLPRDGLKSFHVDVDPTCNEIVRETYYQ
ncbi:hypothetical protein [Stenotrophomonas maltophilia]|uniref:hypothetical protein n=1 Tax=Stenotrophomonas maltophilia TaxID=40324 RepID=UPI001FA7C65C|nr:hypothetical protein [Stenotrophomonas maltophilia]